MTRQTWILWGFIAASLVQAGVPLLGIVKHETTLKYGTEYRFRTAPVDPYDAFRGRYVQLRMAESSVDATNAVEFSKGQKVFFAIAEDADGFAVLRDPSTVRPAEGDYLGIRIRYVRSNSLDLDFPFGRYYMNEKDAPRAEAVYREYSRREAADAFVTVRVRSGHGVLEKLYVAGITIEAFLEREARKEGKQ